MKTITIFSFMLKELKLKGSELLVYALIYSFSQYGQRCFMKPETIGNELGLSRSQVFRVLCSLGNKSLVLNNGEGYVINNRDRYLDKVRDSLAEQIRIAKTPWL